LYQPPAPTLLYTLSLHDALPICPLLGSSIQSLPVLRVRASNFRLRRPPGHVNAGSTVAASDREAQVFAARDDADLDLPVRVGLDRAPPDRERFRLDVGGKLAGAAEDDLAGAELLRRAGDREVDVVRREPERDHRLAVLPGEVHNRREDRLLVGREVRVGS